LIYDQLHSWSGYSVRQLENIFHHFLNQIPPIIDIPELTTEESYLLIDGLWFGKRYCLMLYRHHKRKTLIHASFVSRERGSLIAKDLKILKEKYRFSGIVSDGGTGIGNAVYTKFGNIPHKICMAHLHRDIINTIGRYPKDKRVRDLKRIADHIWLIESKEALNWWRDKLQKWIDKNREFLTETKHLDTGGWWYIHKGVRKAV